MKWKIEMEPRREKAVHGRSEKQGLKSLGSQIKRTKWAHKAAREKKKQTLIKG